LSTVVTTESRARRHDGPSNIGRALLRTGSANFSTSGENAKDNDLIVIHGAGPRSSKRTRIGEAAQPMIDRSAVDFR
jgi:hypothetical protein